MSEKNIFSVKLYSIQSHRESFISKIQPKAAVKKHFKVWKNAKWDFFDWEAKSKVGNISEVQIVRYTCTSDLGTAFVAIGTRIKQGWHNFAVSKRLWKIIWSMQNWSFEFFVCTLFYVKFYYIGQQYCSFVALALQFPELDEPSRKSFREKE